jgi:hypothetical protein
MTVEIKVKLLYELFELVNLNMSENLVELIPELIYVGEWSIALEFIYDFLDDEGVLISRLTYNLIQSLATMMETDTRDWLSLECQIENQREI